MKKTILILSTIFLFLMSSFSIVLADDANTEAAGTPSAMSQEDQEMMVRMKEYSMPNENHQVLNMLVGSWVHASKFWMDPAGEPSTSEGTSNNQLIFGGRFLQQNVTGSFMEQPFEGTGIIGYDNLKKEYKSVWFDNMSTGIMTGTAQYDAATKTLTEEGSLSCPVTNSDRWFRSVTKIIDNDHYTYETFMKDDSGNEYRSMEISYSRVK